MAWLWYLSARLVGGAIAQLPLDELEPLDDEDPEDRDEDEEVDEEPPKAWLRN